MCNFKKTRPSLNALIAIIMTNSAPLTLRSVLFNLDKICLNSLDLSNPIHFHSFPLNSNKSTSSHHSEIAPCLLLNRLYLYQYHYSIDCIYHPITHYVTFVVIHYIINTSILHQLK